jgi:stress-induced-phosphoprotein 1
VAQGCYVTNESGRWAMLILFAHAAADACAGFAYAAAYFEQGDYDKSIEACQKAVDESREVILLFYPAHGDACSCGVFFFTFLGSRGLQAHRKSVRAYRLGLCQKGRPGHCDPVLRKISHRTPHSKLKEVERAKAALDRAAYIDPAQLAVAREKGNRLFKEGDFARAVKSYTESIKRDPNDTRGYNNRALAYTKLVALPEALKDAEEAIRVDPAFGE